MSDISEEDVRELSRERGRRDKPSPRGDNGGSFRDRSRDRGGRDSKSMKTSANRVYVTNLPYEYRWQDLKDLFRSEVGDVAFVELYYDYNDKPKGTGVVEFSESDSVAKCIEVMHGHEVKGRKLFVKKDDGIKRDRHGDVVSGGGPSSKRPKFKDDFRRENSYRSDRNDGNLSNNTYGLSVSFLQSLNIEPPLGTKVFIANLQYNLEKKKLKDAFRLAGRIVRAEIPLDKDGRSRGFGIIEYEHPVEAVQAISMFHNQTFFDRQITVRMDKDNNAFKLPDGFKRIGSGLGPNGEPLKNVPCNLASCNSNQSSQPVNFGSGILGNVANNLPFANAVSGLGGLGALNPQVLQAATLSGLSNNLLGGADLSTLTNAIAANAASQQLAALSQNVSSNLQSNLASANTISNYGRSGDGGGSGDRGGSGNGGGRDYNYGNEGSQRYNSIGSNNGASNRDSGNYGKEVFSSRSADRQDSDSRRKVLISNLPSNVSYKLLSDKFSEYGDVVGFDTKQNGSIILTYQSDWQAERAIKNLDKAKVSGRMIDARLYY